MQTINDYNIDQLKISIKIEQDQIREQMLAVQQQADNLKAFKAAYLSEQSMEKFYSDLEKISLKT